MTLATNYTYSGATIEMNGENSFSVSWYDPDQSQAVSLIGNAANIHVGEFGATLLLTGEASIDYGLTMDLTAGDGGVTGTAGNAFIDNAPNAYATNFTVVDLSDMNVTINSQNVLIGADLQNSESSAATVDMNTYTLIGSAAETIYTGRSETLQGGGGVNVLMAGDGSETLIGGSDATVGNYQGNGAVTGQNTFVLFGSTPDVVYQNAQVNEDGPVTIKNFNIAGNDVLDLPSQIYGVASGASNVYTLTGCDTGETGTQVAAAAVSQGVTKAGFLVIGSGTTGVADVYYFNPHDPNTAGGGAEAYQLAQIHGSGGTTLTAGNLATHISMSNTPLSHISHVA